MKCQYLLAPSFHPPVATRIYFVSECLPFLPNSNRLVWFSQLPRSFVQVLQLQRHLPRAAAHSLPGTPVWPHSLAQAGLAANGSPFSQAPQNLALLVHKSSHPFTDKSELVGKTRIFYLLLKKMFWERVAESHMRELAWYLFTERVPFHQQLCHEDAP